VDHGLFLSSKCGHRDVNELKLKNPRLMLSHQAVVVVRGMPTTTSGGFVFPARRTKAALTAQVPWTCQNVERR